MHAHVKRIARYVFTCTRACAYMDVSAYTTVFTNTNADVSADAIDRDALVPVSTVRDGAGLYKTEYVLAGIAAADHGGWSPITPRMCARVVNDTHVDVLLMHDDALVHRRYRGVFIAVDRWWPLVELAPLGGTAVASLPELSTFTDFSTCGWPDYYAVTSASMSPWQLRALLPPGDLPLPTDTLLVWVVCAPAAPTRAEYAAVYARSEATEPRSAATSLLAERLARCRGSVATETSSGTRTSIHAQQRIYRVRTRGLVSAHAPSPVLTAAKDALVYIDDVGAHVYTWRAGVLTQSIIGGIVSSRDTVHLTPMFDCVIAGTRVLIINGAATGSRHGRNGAIVYPQTYTLDEIASGHAGTAKVVWERRRYEYIAIAFVRERGVSTWDPRVGYVPTGDEQRLLAPANGRDLVLHPANTQYCGRILDMDTFVMTSPMKPRGYA